MTFPFPHEIYNDVTCITLQELERLGVHGLILDIDGTLARTKDPDPSPSVLDWLQEIKQGGIALYILSNNKSPERTCHYASLIGCPWRHKAHKPARQGFREALEELGLEPVEAAVVGDQIYTDVLGGLLSGLKTLMVQSVDSYLWYFPFRRLIELPFRFKRKS